MKNVKKILALLLAVVIFAVVYYAIALYGMYGENPQRNTLIRQEISQLEMALDTYKNKFGEYPPDGLKKTTVREHISQCYPDADPNYVAAIAEEINPATALPMFLGLRSTDPVRPFDWQACDEPRPAILDFDTARLENRQYFPRGRTVPYIYFRAEAGDENGEYEGKTHLDAVAYKERNDRWFAPTKFQVISGGKDNRYHDPAGGNVVQPGMGKADLDNVVSFSLREIRDLLE